MTSNQSLWRMSALVSAIAIVAVLFSLTGRVGANATAFVQPKPGATIATIDLLRLQPLLDERAGLQSRIEEAEARLDAELQPMRERLKRLEESIKDEAVSAEQKFEYSNQALMLQGSIQAAVQRADAILDSINASLMVGLYGKIRNSVQVIAEQEGYDIVFADDRSQTLTRENFSSGAVESYILGRGVMYANKTIDITDIVAKRMNLEYAQNNGGQGG